MDARKQALAARLFARMMRFTRVQPAPKGLGLAKPCKIWTGPTNGGWGASVYGKITIRVDGYPTGVSTHKLSYETFVKRVPDGYDCGHKCHNSLCWEETHLKAITKTANQRERMVHQQQLRSAA